ncbi:protein spinster homolog 1 isoform X2 [Nelusetta ayraudi]|uniref:protein spinster homolog 1 isoform X2 n=1 Tax=Nelusetta ayraudi TaxID=303726 RepID=UPI003F7229B2
MSRAEPTSDSTPLFLSDDSEVEGPEDGGGASGRRREGEGDGEEGEEREGSGVPASGVSDRRALLTVLVLCFVNLLNYMDRFTVAGVLPDIESYFVINDEKSGLLQTVFICSYMVLAPVFGYLGDRYNRRIIMSVGITFWSLVTLGSSFTPKGHFWLLLLTRGLVGVGEASYSTIAPTVIADLYVKGKRTNMLSIFYFAIPVGSGLGYIVGSQVGRLGQDWHWALRVTPGLGLLAVLLLLLVVQEPLRGAVESRPEHQLEATSWLTDLTALSRNRSFVLSTLGFTAVAFVTGSLALWAPTFLYRAAVFTGRQEPCRGANCAASESLIFGAITCVTGVLGVASGVQVSRLLRSRTGRADPLVCAAGLLLSAPFLYLTIVFAQTSVAATYVFIFLGETFLSMNWAIVADILLYVVVPTRRSTAEALQIVFSHLLGDAGSPYLIGVVSDSLRRSDSYLWQFRSLQISLLLCSFVAVVGGAFFLATALFIEEDRDRADKAVLPEEPIVVPKSGRSTRVPVSSVLI